MMIITSLDIGDSRPWTLCPEIPQSGVEGPAPSPPEDLSLYATAPDGTFLTDPDGNVFTIP